MMRIHNDPVLFSVLSALRDENEEKELREARFSGIQYTPEKSAFIEENVAEIVRQGKGREWIKEAFSLYQSEDPIEISYGSKLFNALIEHGMAEDIGTQRRIVRQAINYWLDDETVDDAGKVLIPLADAGYSDCLTISTRTFERAADMLRSPRAAIASPAHRLVQTMAEDKQAPAIANHPTLMTAIVDGYSDDEVSKIYRSEHILETLLKNRKANPIVQESPVLERTSELLTEPKYAKDAQIFALGLAITALRYSENREEVGRYLGRPVLEKIAELSTSWVDLLARPERPTQTTATSNCPVHPLGAD